MWFAGLAGYERAYMRFLILLCVASISYGMENQEKGVVEGARTSVINPLQGWKNYIACHTAQASEQTPLMRGNIQEGSHCEPCQSTCRACVDQHGGKVACCCCFALCLCGGGLVCALCEVGEMHHFVSAAISHSMS